MSDVVAGSGQDFILTNDLVIRDGQRTRLRIDKDTGSIFVHDDDGNIVFLVEMPGANLWIGGNGKDGDLVCHPSTTSNIRDLNQAAFHVDSDRGVVWVGGSQVPGRLICRDDTSAQTLLLDGAAATVRVGANGQDGRLIMQSADNRPRIRFDAQHASAHLGGNGDDGDLLLYNSGGDNQTVGQATIRLDGAAGNMTLAGDITLTNADCAEDFDADDPDQLEPGTVVSLNDDSRLALSAGPYDRRVAGVVAGAGRCRPGIILGREPHERRVPVALIGRTYCKVDASEGCISVGDLLTTASRPGHAMKAQDASRAFGAVVGKALEPLDRGNGLIPVLVALQ